MDCYGNDVGVSNCVRRWRGFPMQKHKRDPSSRPPNSRVCSLRRPPNWFCSAALMHFCHSGFDVVAVCHAVSDVKDNLKSNLSGQSIRTETPPNVARVQFAKIAFHVFFPDFLKSIWICQKNRFGLAVWTKPKRTVDLEVKLERKHTNPSPDAGLAALCRKFCSLKILPSFAPWEEQRQDELYWSQSGKLKNWRTCFTGNRKQIETINLLIRGKAITYLLMAPQLHVLRVLRKPSNRLWVLRRHLPVWGCDLILWNWIVKQFAKLKRTKRYY